MSLTFTIKEKARGLGFDLVGVAPVRPAPELLFYKDWIAAGSLVPTLSVGTRIGNGVLE
jgi:hypothetical protein